MFFTVGNDVIFLDPHTTQQIGMLPNKDIETELKIDQSYHCQQINRLPILNMDPSLAAVSIFVVIVKCLRNQALHIVN